MPFLVIAGITVPIQATGASENAPEQIGAESRSYSGALRSTVRAEKRSWQFTTKPISQADETAIRAAIAAGAFVLCSGEALPVATTCRVNAGSSNYVMVKGNPRRQLTLQLREV